MVKLPFIQCKEYKMKLKRSERIVVMTEYLLNNPNKLIPLTYFVSKFNQAKSSISEDIHIIKNEIKMNVYLWNNI